MKSRYKKSNSKPVLKLPCYEILVKRQPFSIKGPSFSLIILVVLNE